MRSSLGPGGRAARTGDGAEEVPKLLASAVQIAPSDPRTHMQRTQYLLERQLAGRRRLLSQISERLQACHPKAQLTRDRASLRDLNQRLKAAMGLRLVERRQGLGALAGKLDAMSPLKVLGRGYALARDEQGRVVLSDTQVAVGATVDVMLADGGLRCRVEQKARRRP